MFAWVEVLREKDNVMEIAYSLGEEMKLDGRISYEKVTGTIKLEQMAEGASPQATRDFMEALKERMQTKPWGSGQIIRVAYSRSTESELVNSWQMEKQAAFVRFA
ncbi:hypothetical protein [Selenomonas sp. GACV-9]|uniref:hypothetical protein n=1 Tax=Selenomonas sp. GACV-9 TaxID=3158782 RepID=UPI00094DE8D8